MTFHSDKNAEKTRGEDTHWSAVFAMSLCVFVLIASEFLPISLLTPIARDLHVHEGQAGQAISVSGVFAVITSLFIATLAGKCDRKQLLLGLTGLMVISGIMAALAYDYVLFMISRALLGVVIGGFWSISAATAMRLVPVSKTPKALTIFNAGNALATVIAPPFGSFLGSLTGWRGAFFCVVPVAIVAFIWQWISLPSMKVEAHASPGAIIRILKRPFMALGMAAVGIFFMGQFSLFTYVRPFLEQVTHITISELSLLLFVIGCAGFTGTTLIGIFLKKRIYQTLILPPVFMAIIAVFLIISGHNPVLTASLLIGWGLISTPAPVAWWAWLARSLPEEAEAGGGLMVALIQGAITLGTVTGGLLFDHSGYQLTFITSAVLLVFAACLAFLTSRAARHKIL